MASATNSARRWPRAASTHRCCVNAPGRQTFTYTKLLNLTNGEEDLPRIDFISTDDVPADVEDALLARVRESWEPST